MGKYQRGPPSSALSFSHRNDFHRRSYRHRSVSRLWALYNGGPIGALLGYSIVGTVVYCLCVSIGEMIAYLPNVGGVVGLADLFVDPALGFSLGWAAWYNWSITLPTEISAATILVRLWDPDHNLPVIVLSTIFLVAATAVNCFPSRVYGELEFWFSAIKVLTIVLIIAVCIVVDLGGGNKGYIGIQYWKTPFKSYQSITGSLGHFLGFWAVLLQACFSFFGSDVPGIAAGEVIDATRNVPRALRRVWIRITIFYVGSIFCAGLVVDSSDPRLSSKDTHNTAQSSPFVIAFENAGLRFLPYLINGAILLSAWSAAASDIYIGSRFLFFLSKNHHAPGVFAYLQRYPRDDSKKSSSSRDSSRSEEEEDWVDVNELDDDELEMVSTTGTDSASAMDSSATRRKSHQARRRYTRQDRGAGTGSIIAEEDRHSVQGSNTSVPGNSQMMLEPNFPADNDNVLEGLEYGSQDDSDGEDNESVEDSETWRRITSHTADPESQYTTKKSDGPWFVLPLYAVLMTAAIGLLSFMGTGDTHVQTAFGWLSAVASIASLQSWMGMLFTYIRWYQGTIYHEKKHRAEAEAGDERSIQVMRNIARIKENRHRGQPYLAWYAFTIGMLILFTNGWAVFLHGWRIANIPDVDQGPKPDVATFLASYIPLPFFALLTLGYKIIHQTKLVQLEEMDFEKVYFVPEEVHRPPTRRERILGHLLVI
ncbi:amino acid permease-domain-containing protein [Irpex rosettiformis]|uniref:Amino acid permease-domain-containing protein n=1 Tax=Irpex rosettiformis TaxID=378272 RepID=A0ACB8U3J1_9APHY|nr:amino acid permease-domain-containing protein [Irpex rosettiformis]